MVITRFRAKTQMLTTCSHLHKGVKRYPDEFPISHRTISPHVDYFKPTKIFEKNVGKKSIIFHKGGVGYPFAENIAKINNLIFEAFPN